MKTIPFNDFRAEAKTRHQPLTQAFQRVLKSGWYILGTEVTQFEQEFAKYLDTRHCIGVANGLEALQIALMSLNIGPGDEIITTPLSAVATTLAVLAIGATPIFVDVDDHGLIDAQKIESAITKKTRAILPVHLYGQSVDLSTIKQLCQKYHLYLVEDAAQAHGTTFKNQKVGTFGSLSCFSFYPTKNLGALGDGGAIVTNSSKLATNCRQIRNYGEKTRYQHLRYGLNSRLDELQAAFLRTKLKNLDSSNEKRRLLAKRYIQNLSKNPSVKIVTTNFDHSSMHLFVIRTPNRNQLQQFLTQNHIQTLIHYPTLIPDQPFLRKKYQSAILPNARTFVKEILSLPCHPYLTTADIDYICTKIHQFTT